jgi:hypothetical protein
MLFPWGTTVAKAMADPRRRRGRTKAIKTFMVKSAYPSMGLSRMSQTGAPGRLSFSISALRVRLTHAINATPTSLR